MADMAAILISLIFILIGFSPAIAVINNENGRDGLQTYIVYVQKPKKGIFSKKIDLDSWYQSFLPATISNPKSRMMYCYRNAISGFAARLTAEEVKSIETKRGFISAHVEKKLQLHTTHTPNFLGLHQNSGIWKDSNMGRGVIIGVLDSGITPGHPSFNDEGMPPPPAKWKGKCELEGATCNNKLIGARNFFGTKSEPAIDFVGHGTHTASTAAGNFVNGANLFGLANGTAVGMAPLAHLAIYKVQNQSKAIPDSVIIDAIEAAVEDGVDVLSISLGVGFSPFFNNSIAIAAFSATQKGVFVSISASNYGPNHYTLVNDAPWMLTVGASTTDRSIIASTELGNQVSYDGKPLFAAKDFPSKQLPLVYSGMRNPSEALCSPETLESIDVKGKIVLCQRRGATGSIEMEKHVKDAGGVGMILMNDEQTGETNIVEIHELPTMHVSYKVGKEIEAYINSTSSPTAAIVLKTVIGKISAPKVAGSSSRGPSRASPGILKPDIIGPGVDILAAWPSSVENISNTIPTFQFHTGTSMSCPHLSGIAALLKSAHPDWSPAAIKSAIMTTADTDNLECKPIADYNGLTADLFAVGAGHVNPSKANNPGLIYDIHHNDYVRYLCGLNYTDQQVHVITKYDVQCSKVSSIAEAELNYPSFSIKLGCNPQTYNRTVTNVGEANSSYTHQIIAPEGVDIIVQPNLLSFAEKNQKVTYSVTFIKTQKTGAPSAQAYLSWVSGIHTVKSPIAISFE